MITKQFIEAAIIKAQEKHPDLKELDNPYERIAEFLDMKEIFPEIDGENSFQWAERCEAEIDSVWSNMDE